METHSLRLYQQQVLDQCIQYSTIAILPTGSGKTLIASYLIKNQIVQKKLRRPSTTTSQNTITVFIAPNKVLLSQQIKYLQTTNNSLVKINIAEINGESKQNGKQVDGWGQLEWNVYLQKYDVLGMTPEILRRLIEQSLLKTDLIDCLIFDECHHILGKNDPMGKICDVLYDRCGSKKPLVLGITASPTQSKKGTFEGNITKLETRMGGKVFVPNRDTIECLKTHVNRPVFYTANYSIDDTFQDDFMATSIMRLQHAVHIRYLHQYQFTLDKRIGESEQLVHIGIPADSMEYVVQWLTQCLPQNSFSNEKLRKSEIRKAADMSHNMLCYVQETVSQCGRVAKECGSYCAFTALLTLLPDYLDYARWGGFHLTTLSKIEEVRFNAIIQEIYEGPFLCEARIGDGMTLMDRSRCYPSRAPEIFSTHLAVVLSLFEFFISLFLAIPMQVRMDIVSRNALQSKDGSKSVFHLLVEWLHKYYQHYHQGKGSSSPGGDDHYPTVQYLYGGVILLMHHDGSGMAPFVFEGHRVVNMSQYLSSLQSICESIKAALPLTALLQYTTNSTSLEAECMEYKKSLELQPFKGVSAPSMDIAGGVKIAEEDGLFSKKLVALIQTWCFFWWKNGRNPTMSSIVFCEMKLTVRTINALFNSLHAQNNKALSDGLPDVTLDRMTTPKKVRLTETESIAIRSSALFGDNSQIEQSQVLSRIKKDEINILITTNIAEEGLDIKSCQVVINFDHPQTAKSFIQRMGRARADSASMISLIGSGDSKIVEDLKKFTEEAKRFDDSTGEFWDYLRKLKDIREGSAMEADNDEDHVDKASSSELDNYTVPTTGATVDIISAKAVVHQYCQSIATDAFHSVTPIFAVQVLSSDSKSTPPSFRCSLLMPKQVPNRARCAVSPPCSKKSAAVGTAAIEAVRKLHESGELNDHLVVLKAEIAQLEMAKSSKCQTIVTVKVKTCPDNVLLGLAATDFTLGGSWGPRVLHLYAVVGEGNQFKSQHLESIAGCNDLQIGFEVLSNMCIALTQELSEDLLREKFILNFGKSAWKEYQFKHITTIAVRDASEYRKLVFFHRSAYLRELMLHSFQDIIVTNSDEDFDAITPQLNADCNAHMEIHEQDISSSMLVLPLPSSLAAFATDKAMSYCSCVEICALETQILLHNIHLVRKSQEGAGAKVILSEVNERWKDPASLSSPQQVYDEYQGMIMRSVANSIIRVARVSSHEVVHLNSITSFGKKSKPSLAPSDLPEPFNLALPMSMERESQSADSSTTYAQYFMGKYPLPLQSIIAELYAKCEAAPLLTVYTLPTEDKPRDLLFNQGMGLKREVNHVLPHSCTPLGRARWHYVKIFYPSVVTRLKSLLLAEEARACVLTLMPVSSSSYSSNDVKSKTTSHHHHRHHRLPTVNEILQAITPRAAEESINSERLEMLGDSFLKFICSQELFERHQSRHQGFLTAARARIVSNANLHESVAKSTISQYLRVETLKQTVKENGRNAERNGERFVSANVQYKLLADMAEALTAVYYLAGGVSLGKSFLGAIGVNLSSAKEEEKVPEKHVSMKLSAYDEDELIIPPEFDDKLKELLRNGSTASYSSCTSSSNSKTGMTTTTAAYSNRQFSAQMNESNLKAFESQLGYHFKDVGLLMEALTHASMQNCRSNERLEFYGDAILDFCVVYMLYTGNPYLQQGELSQYKSCITCNKMLAQFAVRLGLHKYLLQCSFSLADVLDKISQLVVDRCNSSVNTIKQDYENEDEKQHVSKKVRRVDLELPTDVKFLADAFEAIIAAIYIDSGSSLDTICDVIRNLKMIPDEYLRLNL